VRIPGTADPVEPGDRFRIASLSKVITSIVVHRLAAEGRLDLDAPVGRRLADAVGAGPIDPSVQAVTPRQLLGHTTGFPVDRTIWFGNGASDCPDAARRILLRGAVAPGGFQYSNTNFCLLGLLVAEITGQPYEDTVNQLLLGPLGISGMRLAGTYDVGPDEVLHVSAPDRNYMEVLGGAGSWLASPRDVVRILDTLRFTPPSTGPGSIDGSAGAYRPLDDPTLFAMRLPSTPGGWYGSGLMLFDDGSVGHTGTVEETRAMAVTRPDGVTWAVLVSGTAPGQSSGLADLVDAAVAAAFPAGPAG
jgi:D-alanyl-D-alanine carboxypeptidase